MELLLGYLPSQLLRIVDDRTGILYPMNVPSSREWGTIKYTDSPCPACCLSFEPNIMRYVPHNISEQSGNMPVIGSVLSETGICDANFVLNILP